MTAVDKQLEELAIRHAVNVMPIYGASGIVVSYSIPKQFRTKTDAIEWLKRLG